ncbi:ABC transporter transmembrane domain-containing protein [Glutamicibacter ardleyensis]|uniref:ABC transporter transmembrane domain-containing protein n=1 Tax=Glutamicibacter ardleyensis TaxID=225894 RepID=UPI003FD12A6D
MLAVSGFCGHQLAEVMVPIAVGLVIDRAIAPADPSMLGWALLFLGGVFTVLICSWQLGDRLGTKAYAHGEHALRQRTLGRAMRGRDRRPAGEVLTISSSDASESAGLIWVIAEQAAALTAVFVACITLLTIAWPLAVTVVLGTLVQVVLVHAVSGGLRRRGYEAQRRAARLDAVSTDFATGIRVLGALGGAHRAARRYAEESATAADAAYLAARSTAALNALNLLVSGLAFTGIALLGGWLAQRGLITIGGFVMAMGLAQTIRGPLQTLGYLPAEIAAKHGSAKRISEFAVQAGDGRREPVNPPHAVLENVAGAPGAAALSVVASGRRIDIPAGEIIGIRADPERSTDLAQLLGGRRPAAPGELRIGTSVGRIDDDALRAVVFAPPHDSAVFSGTAAENIAEQIEKRHLVTAAFDEVVGRLPDGLNSRVGERGMLLSGGQRQRLLLARALHQPQPIIVLHEPTTAMDPMTEAQVARRLAASGRTIILLTDRAPLLAACSSVHDLREHAND